MSTRGRSFQSCGRNCGQALSVNVTRAKCSRERQRTQARPTGLNGVVGRACAAKQGKSSLLDAGSGSDIRRLSKPHKRKSDDRVACADVGRRSNMCRMEYHQRGCNLSVMARYEIRVRHGSQDVVYLYDDPALALRKVATLIRGGAAFAILGEDDQIVSVEDLAEAAGRSDAS